MGRRLMATIRLRYLHSYKDRHGRKRHYFRRGRTSIPIPGEPGTKEFSDAYHAAFRSEPAPKPKGIVKGSFKELAMAYFGSPQFQSLAPSSRMNYRRVVEGFLVSHGDRLVAQMRREHVIKIIGAKAGTPSAASVLLKRLRTLCRFALDLGWIATDPTHKVRSFRSKEFHTWTEEEIAEFEAHWQAGTKQRLAFALHLYTGQRGSDVHRMTWRDVAGDSIRVVQRKTGTKLTIALHPDLQDVLACTRREHISIIATEYGKPFSVKGFGNFMSDSIRAAGLPERCVAHGLRKAAARRLAEAGCSAREIMAVTGHKTLAEVERYTAAAEQEHLNRQAIERIGNKDWLPTRGGSPKREKVLEFSREKKADGAP